MVVCILYVMIAASLRLRGSSANNAASQKFSNAFQALRSGLLTLWCRFGSKSITDDYRRFNTIVHRKEKTASKTLWAAVVFAATVALAMRLTIIKNRLKSWFSTVVAKGQRNVHLLCHDNPTLRRASYN